VIIFSVFLGAFFSFANLLTAILLPVYFGAPINICWQEVVLGYPCEF